MTVKRIVSIDFWTDGKVDEFSPEDKYFMLYLLTNPFSAQLGIYEISIKQAAFQLGYSEETVRCLLDRFENKYGMIIFSKKTNEVAIKNYLRHSIVKGGKPVEDCLWKEILKVKNKQLIYQVFRHIIKFDGLNATVSKVIFKFDPSILNEKDNDNDNDNDNDDSYHDSYNDSYHDSYNDSSGGPPKMPDKPEKNLVPALSFDYSGTTFSPTMIEEVEKWLQYKKERRESYKPTGLKALISEIQNNVDRYGEAAVIELIHTCMASNWKGIIFERLKQPSRQQNYSNRRDTGFESSNPFLEMLKEERGQ